MPQGMASRLRPNSTGLVLSLGLFRLGLGLGHVLGLKLIESKAET